VTTHPQSEKEGNPTLEDIENENKTEEWFEQQCQSVTHIIRDLPKQHAW
jgi:hypothetical protein